MGYSGSSSNDLATVTANGSYTDYSFNTDDYVTSGEMTIEVSRDQGNGSDSVELTVDNEKPQVESINLDDRVNSEFGPVQFEISDQSDVIDLDVEIDDGDALDENFDCGEESCSGELEVNFPESELDHDNSYDLTIVAEDEYGNELNFNQEFVYDNRFEGDTDLEVTPEPQVFDGSGPEEFLVTVDEEDEDSDIRLKCRPDSWFDGFSDFRDIDGSEDFTCSHQSVSFDINYDMEVVLEDEAGNTETVDIGEYFFDQTDPTIENLSAVVGVFNRDFQVSYDAYDTEDVEGLDVEKIHYQLDDSDLDLSSGSNVSEVDGDFEVNTSGLSSGQHTVYVWAVDRAGRVSDLSSFEFNFKPDAEPEVALGSVDSLSVTAGNSQTVSVNVTNTGELFVGSMELSLVSDIRNSSRNLNDLKPGDMESGLFSVDTSSDDLGVHQLEFSTESPDSSRTLRFVVEANKEQENKINSEYDEYISKYDSLKANVSQLKNSGLSSSRKETLDSNSSEFFSSMESARRAMENGDLYLVEKHMESIDTDFQQASNTYDTVQKQHQRAERNQNITLVFLLFVGIGGTGLAYVTFFSDEYNLSMEALEEEYEFLEGPVQTVQTTLDQYELTLEPLENLVGKISEALIEEEKEIEEAEEQAFQGFT